MSSPNGYIRSELDGDVLRVALNRPEVRNAQTPQMWQHLVQIAESVSPQTRFVVLTGQGVDFSAGLDRSVLADTGPEGMIAALQGDPEAFITTAQRAFRAWSELPQVVIAAVQGNVIGAGFQLALARDVLIAAPGARFALRAPSIGLVPDLGGTGALIDSIGYRRTFALCATGAFLSAQDAAAAGLVHTMDEDLTSAVESILATLRGVDAGSLADLKKLLRAVAHDLDSWGDERRIQVQRLQSLFGQVRS